MLPKGKLTVLQTYMLLVLAIGFVNHVMIIPLLLSTSNKDSVISVLFALLICMLWLFIPYWIAKYTQQANLMQWIAKRTHRSIAVALSILFCLYLFCNAFFALKDVLVWTNVTYLPQTPIWITSLSLMLLCLYSASKGVRSLAICAGILFPFVMLLGFFVIAVNMQYKRYNLLLPLFTTDVSSIATSVLYVLSNLFEIWMIVLLQHHIQGKINVYHLMIVVGLMAVLTLAPLTGAIASFGYESVQLRYPAHEQWRLVKIGKYISHVDFLSIFQWLATSFIRISLALYLIGELMQFRKKRNTMIGLGTASIVLFVCSVLPFSDMQYAAYINRYFIICFFGLAVVSICILALVLWKRRKKEAPSA